jgi:GPH family glycoside/pentoside/hexuronide:cation symporter
MNGIFGFAMLFYTKALGLDPTWAGLAMSLSVFWEAVSEPIMGHISDRTRSRWGRRHPYMLVGGLLMATCSYLIWVVPDAARGSQMTVFWYLLLINLVLRTGLTLFFIPYLALGFEMCSDYEGRARLQSYRQVFNMAANFAGPAMAWSLFFQDQPGVQATTVESNYQTMGAVFAAGTAVFVLVAVFGTLRWLEDSRTPGPALSRSGWLADFGRELRGIALDPNPRWVFVFVFTVCAGMVVVSSLQMFVYDDFMRLSSGEKSVAHGGTMVGMALGAVLATGAVRRLDKRGAVLLGGVISVAANCGLALLFLTGWMDPGATATLGGFNIPVALVAFVILHSGYWLGNGIMLPTATAMMADVSEMHRIRTGERKDGAYSAAFSLAMRIAISCSLMLAGWCLEATGYQVPKEGASVVQDPAAIWRLGLVTFVVGAVICGASLFAIRRYPVTREVLDRLRAPSR